MTSKWNQFNSDLLDALKKGWKGHFYAKFIKGFNIYKETGNLEETVLSIFKHTSTEAKEPTPYAIDNFGYGDVGRDFEVLNFVNNLIRNCIESVLAGDFIGATDKIKNFGKKILDKINWNDIDRSLLFYFCILKFLYCFLVEEETNLGVKMGDIEDLAFFGCLSLLDALIAKDRKKPNVSMLPFEVTNENNRNYLHIDTSILEKIKTDAGYADSLVSDFIDVNKGLFELKEYEFSLEKGMSGVLSNSSFLWGDSDFGFDIDFEDIARNPENTLIRNKCAVLERCFYHILPIFSDKTNAQASVERVLDVKNAIMACGNVIQRFLNTIDEKRAQLKEWNKKAKETYTSLIDIASSRGLNEVDAIERILKIICKRDLSQIDLSDQDPILVSLLKEYQAAVIEEQKLISEINEIDRDLQKERDKLEDLFDTFVSNNLNREPYMDTVISLLEINTVFSFILLNKDIFPEVSLKGETRKTGVKRIAKAFEKLSQKFAFKKMQGYELPWAQSKLERLPVSPDAINTQLQKIYETYNPQTKKYYHNSLSEEEVERIALAAKNIKESAARNDPEALQKFLRLEHILEEIFIKDHALIATINKYGKKVDADSKEAAMMPTMNAYINTALLFAGNKDSMRLAGISNSEGFRKIFNVILKSMTPEGLKVELGKEADMLLEQARNLSLPVKNVQDSIESIIQEKAKSRDFIKDLEEEKSYLVRTKISEPFGVEEFQKAYNYLVEDFKHQIYSDAFRWLLTYENLKRAFISEPSEEFLNENHAIYKSFKTEMLPYLPKIVQKYLLHGIDLPQTTKAFPESFRRFFQENDFKLASLQQKESGWRQIPIETTYLFILPYVANKIKDKILELSEERQEKYALSTNPLKMDVDIFSNQTLFQFFENQKVDSIKNQKLLENLYYEFLPVFICSYLTTKNIFSGEERKKFNEVKMNFIENLPEARGASSRLENILNKHQVAINDLNKWLEEQTRKNKAFIEQSPESASNFILSTIQEAIKGPAKSIYEEVKSLFITSTIIGCGLMFAFTNLGILTGKIGTQPMIVGTILISLATSLGLKHAALPFVENIIARTWESIQKFFGIGGYSPSAPNKCILEIFEVAFENELTAFHRFKEARHTMNYTIYIQEMFEMLENAQNNLFGFQGKIGNLAPCVEKAANFSVLGLNMFCMLNKELFLVVPPTILREVQNPYFLNGIEEYLRRYKEKLMSLQEKSGRQYKMDYDFDTQLADYLKDLAEKGDINLRFSSDSDVGKLLGGIDVEFPVKPENIVPFNKINPKQTKNNVQEFLEITSRLLRQRDRFDYELGKVFRKFERTYDKQLNEEEEEHVIRALVSCFDIVRYSFSMSKSWYDIEKGYIDPDYAKWLRATGETAKSIMSSELFNTAISCLYKTAEFAAALNINDGHILLNLMKKLKSHQQELLSGGSLFPVTFKVWEEIQLKLFTILNEHLPERPIIAYPILTELNENRGLFLPLVVLEGFKAELSKTASTEEAVSVLSLMRHSKILYLSNKENEILFATPKSRAFALSPNFVNAMHQMAQDYQNVELLSFLGAVQEKPIKEEKSGIGGFFSNLFSPFKPKAIEQKPPRIEEEPQARPPLRPDQTYWVPAASRDAFSNVNPEVKMPRSSYDLDKLGLSPRDSYIYYGERLPYAVYNRLKGFYGDIRDLQKFIPIEEPKGMQPQLPRRRAITGPEEMQPMLMDEGEEQLPIEEQKQIGEAEPLSNQIQVGVDAEGRSISTGAGAAGSGIDWEKHLKADEERERRWNEPSFPPHSGRPYYNPIREDYEPIQEEGGFWKKALGIGALGAGLAGAGYWAAKRGEKKRGKK